MQAQPRTNNANRVNIANPTYQKCASVSASLTATLNRKLQCLSTSRLLATVAALSSAAFRASCQHVCSATRERTSADTCNILFGCRWRPRECCDMLRRFKLLTVLPCSAETGNGGDGGNGASALDGNSIAIGGSARLPMAACCIAGKLASWACFIQQYVRAAVNGLYYCRAVCNFANETL